MKEDEDEDEDIEASIQKEISGMAATKNAPKMFQPVFLDVQCVLFFKLQPAIDPVDFVHRICEEAASNLTGRKHRFLNRLTPMTRMGRATQTDLEGLAREVLQKEFRLVNGDGKAGKEGQADSQDRCSVSFLFSVFGVLICVQRLLRGNHSQVRGLYRRMQMRILNSMHFGEAFILTYHSMRSDQQSVTTVSSSVML